MDSYSNAKEIIGLLWIPKEFVMEWLGSYGFQWELQEDHWNPIESYGNGKVILQIPTAS